MMLNPCLGCFEKQQIIDRLQEENESLKRQLNDWKRVQTTSEAELAALREKLDQRDAELARLIKQDINKTVNQPSSKQPEFDKDTMGSKKRKRKKQRKGRKGAGNR